ncbi:hypothetical protein OIU76_000209 [Salix suchowensis]|nr:hypothetical protein OIU76_000209 [Salix suchowensis]
MILCLQFIFLRVFSQQNREREWWISDHIVAFEPTMRCVCT